MNKVALKSFAVKANVNPGLRSQPTHACHGPVLWQKIAVNLNGPSTNPWLTIPPLSLADIQHA